MKSAILLSTSWLGLVAAQRYTYTTRTVTECFSTTPASFGPPRPTQGLHEICSITMPECQDYQSHGYTCTHEYAATFDSLLPQGTAPWPYTVKEIYPGMSTLPIVAAPTKLPQGFAAALTTCRVLKRPVGRRYRDVSSRFTPIPANRARTQERT